MFLDPDKTLSVFSSSGKLTACENALRAACNSALSLGMASPDGCVLVSFKNVHGLVDKARYHKVFQVCPTIGVTYSGLQPDFRTQLLIAQEICQDYFDVFERYPSLERFVSEFCMEVQSYSQKQGLRPFGTLLIFCGRGRNGLQCFKVDPSGSYAMENTVATGAGAENARAFMKQRVEMLDDNIANAVQALTENAGRELLPEDVSIGVLRDGVFRIYDEEGVKEVFDSLKH